MATKAAILLFGLIATLVVSFSAVGIADARQNDKGDLELADADYLELIRSDARQWISSQDKDYEQFASETRVQYDGWLRSAIEEVRVETQTQALSEDEIQEAMDYIISEAVKEEDIRLIRESSAKDDPLDALFYDLLGIQFAEAVCPATTTPTFVQHVIDINGGYYNGHYYDGGNGLYDVEVIRGPYLCKDTFTLYFHDEDHPKYDSFYDGIRLIVYQRIHDIEKFTIVNNNNIGFYHTWSNTNKYDCTPSLGFACHASATVPYYGGNVYVSNTWNHMMDTSNTNPYLTTKVIY